MKSMQNLTGRFDRRGFLGTGAGALAAAATLGDGQPAAAQATAKNKQTAELPKRTLGRTGASVIDPQPRHLDEPGGRAVAPLRLGQRHPLRRHGQELRLRAHDRPLAPGDARRPATTCSWSPRTSRTRPSSSSGNWTSGWRRSRPTTST